MTLSTDAHSPGPKNEAGECDFSSPAKLVNIVVALREPPTESETMESKFDSAAKLQLRAGHASGLSDGDYGRLREVRLPDWFVADGRREVIFEAL